MRPRIHLSKSRPYSRFSLSAHHIKHIHNGRRLETPLEDRQSKAKKPKPATARPLPADMSFIGGPNVRRSFPDNVRATIYRYLLHSTHTKVDIDNQDDSDDVLSAHTYKFHTNILRASRAVYAEAKQVLYQENTFIVVSYEEACFEQNITKAYAVPLVSTITWAIGRMADHPLTIHFERKPVSPTDTQFCKCCRVPQALKRCLIIEADLDKFVRFCRISNHLTLGNDFLLIDSSRDEKVHYFQPEKDHLPATTSFHFHATLVGLPSLDKQRSLLEPFHKVVGSRKVVITGADAALAEDVRTSMMPKVVWGYSMCWDLVELMRDFKQEGDKAAEEKKMLLARDRYSCCVQFAGNAFAFRHLDRDRNKTFTTRQCCDWLEEWRIINFDIALACATLQLWSGTDSEANLFMDDALKFGKKMAHLPYERAREAMYVKGIVKGTMGDCRASYKCLKAAREIEKMVDFEKNPELARDYRIAKDHKKQGHDINGCGQAPTVFICRSGLNNGRSLAAVDTVFYGERPEGLVGWQDTLHRLSDADIKHKGVSKHDVPPRLAAADDVDVPMECEVEEYGADALQEHDVVCASDLTGPFGMEPPEGCIVC